MTSARCLDKIMPFQSTKTYGQELGLSCCFRQPNAVHSHCSKLHGYALGFKFIFEADQLDELNWVMDFGGLKVLKTALQNTFDHKLIVSGDDPELEMFMRLHEARIADVLVFPGGVGCELFAQRAYHIAVGVVSKLQDDVANGMGRVRVVSCECSEHGANSATYIGGK